MSKRSVYASLGGITRANQALVHNQLSIKSLAVELDLSRSTVSKFFNGKSVDRLNFIEICEKLDLEWEEIIDKSSLPNQEEIVRSTGIKQETTVSVGAMKSERGEGSVIVLLDEINNSQKASVTQGQQVNTQSQTQFTVVKLKGKLKTNIDISLESTFTEDTNIQIQYEDILRKVQNLVKELEKTVSEHTNLELRDVKEGCVRLILSGTQEDLKRLEELFNSGQLIEVQGIPIENIQLIARGKDLSNIDLSNANLSDADLRGANLSNANLSGANLSDSRLSRAVLTGVDLSNANLSDADLGDADLSNANLNGADLSDADLSGTNLWGVKINSKIKLDSKWRLVWEIVNQEAVGKNLSNADLSDANLEYANLEGAYLRGANLEYANLEGAYLRGANLEGAYLRDAYLEYANLEGAYLRDAYLEGANLEYANLEGANLVRAKVKNARFASNPGISKQMKLNLIQRGAIFDDSSGNPSKVLIRA
ncbi:MAG: pentapeptide repeat-containing protein [Calothrix sp. MO_167.B42]|nr:pentapeptide repeat-containing protein [Calothrix sp. MO_167.B42]